MTAVDIIGVDTNDVVFRGEPRPHEHILRHSFLPNTWACLLCGHAVTEEVMPQTTRESVAS